MEDTSSKSLVTKDYPVNMIPFSDEAVIALCSEILLAEGIGKYNTLNIPAAFDTEASSFYDGDNDWEVGLLYIWMFGINKTVVYSRHLEDFVSLVTKVNRFLKEYNSKLIVYVHFLKYDFSFIKKLFEWDDVFIRAMREPLYAKYGNIEFRDSLVLAGGRGLDYIGKHLHTKVLKATGDLDYDKIRTPETPMTQQELHYCEMDVRVLCQYIREKIEDDGDITKIPYTNTGYVRNYCRNACFEKRGQYMDFIDGLTLTPDAYVQCERAFAGGAVGPNIRYVGQTIENVHSYDIKSSYPYVMVTQYFPMQYPLPVSNKEANKNLETLVTKHCCLFTLEVFDLMPTQDFCFPISEHKCNEVIGARTASGRVITAMYVSINVTELDYITFKRFYNITPDNSRVSRFRIFTKGYLPKPLVKSILEFFNRKTTLDGVEGKEQEYMISKNMLNSCYGMMVEKIARHEFLYLNDKDFYKGGIDYVKDVVNYNEKRNRFLYYPWGVWVTAHARYRLYDAVWNIGDDYRYVDTDSVKFVGEHTDYFNRVNKEAERNIYALCKRMHFSYDFAMPCSPDGDRKVLGVWEHEYDAKRFKTIGAKRYLVEYTNGKLALTVAGTNKTSSLEYMKQKALVTKDSVFDIFNENLEIPPEYAKRTTAKFIDNFRDGYVTDYLGNRYWYESPSGVYIKPTGYSFSITEEMLDAILYLTHDGHYSEEDV